MSPSRAAKTRWRDPRHSYTRRLVSDTPSLAEAGTEANAPPPAVGGAHESTR